jgi:hypothetical protein
MRIGERVGEDEPMWTSSDVPTWFEYGEYSTELLKRLRESVAYLAACE